jgi:hypothetical protein
MKVVQEEPGRDTVFKRRDILSIDTHVEILKTLLGVLPKKSARYNRVIDELCSLVGVGDE